MAWVNGKAIYNTARNLWHGFRRNNHPASFPRDIDITVTKACNLRCTFCISQIDTDGSMRFCYHSWPQRLGFFDDGFEKVWNGESYSKIRSSVDSEKPYYPYCRYCPTRLGEGVREAHDQALHSESYFIPGLEHLQIPFNKRQEENIRSFKELRDKS